MGWPLDPRSWWSDAASMPAAAWLDQWSDATRGGSTRRAPQPSRRISCSTSSSGISGRFLGRRVTLDRFGRSVAADTRRRHDPPPVRRARCRAARVGRRLGRCARPYRVGACIRCLGGAGRDRLHWRRRRVVVPHWLRLDRTILLPRLPREMEVLSGRGRGPGGAVSVCGWARCASRSISTASAARSWKA